MKKSFLLLLFIALFSGYVVAQLSEGGIPYSFKNPVKSNIEFIEMPKFDAAALLLEDEASPNKKLRFGKAFKVNFDLTNSGNWISLENGDKIWQLGLSSTNAFSMGLVLKSYKLPKGATLFVYNAEKENVIGAYTEKNNNAEGILALENVPTDKIVVEYYEPADAEFKGEIAIGTVTHDYRGLFASSKDLSCMPNINCPDGDNWQIEKRAVTKMVYVDGEYQYLCTGALVNNTNNDGTPYFLTAQHCLSTQVVASTVVFHFNYEAATCEAATGTSQTLSGSTLRAVPPASTYDYALLELNNTPPPAYNPYYAGWDRSTTAPTSAAGIHHPEGSLKRISLDNNSLTTGSFSGYLASSHWRISTWEVGATAGGSSGSPIFNSNHRIVGDLTGGASECGNPTNDLYQKFNLAWESASTSGAQQLKYWLDPAGTNPTFIDGLDPYDIGPSISVLAESFEGATFPPTGWVKQSSSANTWATSTGYTIAGDTPTPINPQDGSKFAFVQWHGTAAQNEWLISPALDLTDATGLALSFYFNGSYYWSVTPNNNCNFEVKAKIGEGAWANIWDEDSFGTWATYEWINVYISDLTAYEGQSDVKFAFVYTGTDGANFNLDNILLTKQSNQFEVNFSVIGLNGILSASVDGTDIQTGDNVDGGSTVVFTATPEDGFILKEWKVNSEIVTVEGTSDTFTGSVLEVIDLGENTTVSVEFELDTNVNERLFSNLNIYPNPFTNRINLKNAIGLKRVKITNLLGQRLFESTVEGTRSISIPTNEFVSGVYLIVLENGNGEKEVRRIVKQ